LFFNPLVIITSAAFVKTIFFLLIIYIKALKLIKINNVATQQMILADLNIVGKNQKVSMQTPKNSFFK
jgi:hypothetical protein